jgi:hypothetical protein
MSVDRIDFIPGFDAVVQTLVAPTMDQIGGEIATAQRARIPVSRDGSHGRPPGYARSRIRVWRGVDGTGPYRDIGSDARTPDGTSYPAILDLGSAPHVIESKGDYPLRNRRTGQVFGRRVMHPGTRPTAWCRGSLEAVRGRTYYV